MPESPQQRDAIRRRQYTLDSVVGLENQGWDEGRATKRHGFSVKGHLKIAAKLIYIIILNFDRKVLKGGEMAPLLRAGTALAEDLSLVTISLVRASEQPVTSAQGAPLPLASTDIRTHFYIHS